jgi:glycosyltransferase involved in cell wall biosynthesis
MRSRSTLPTVLATNPNSDLYGASRMLLESVRGFLGRGWRVVACVPAGPLADELRGLGVEVRWVPSPVLRRASLNPRGLLELVALTLRSVPAQVRLLRSVRPDVVYVNTLIQPLWLFLSRCLGLPAVCHVHEAESTMSWPVRKALAFPLLVARKVIANSRFCGDVLVDAWPRLRDRCELVYNGVGGPGTPRPPRERLDPPLRLLYVGRISERKGVQDAVDALAALEARSVVARLDVVGDVFPGYEDVLEDVQRRASEAGTADRLRLHGFDADVWPHLAEADLLLVPSRLEETFGNVAVEGLMAARPTIVSETSGLIEAVDGFAAARVVPPAAPEMLADAIAEVVRDWPAVAARAQADAGRAADRFSLARYRDGIAAVTESAAGLTPG